MKKNNDAAEFNVDEFLRLADDYLKENHDYLWLKTMLEKGRGTTIPGSTLIIGNSYALYGIRERAWKNAINCSMFSQDIYYDFLCARRVLASEKEGTSFDRCLIIMGYYGAFQDLSLSTAEREERLSKIFYPIFRDAHNWTEPIPYDPWSPVGDVPEPVKLHCERTVVERILAIGTYFDLHFRRSFSDLRGSRSWSEAPEADRKAIGASRAADHNRLFRHKASLEENKGIFRELVRFLRSRDVTPIVVIPPFTEEYNRSILKAMKDSVPEMLDSVPEEVHYVDFNEAPDLFEPADFMDADHLSAAGAEKMSAILADMFGSA